MATEIRSELIKSFMGDKQSLADKVRNTTKAEMNKLLKEAVKDNFEQMISEAKDDEYTEEEDTEDVNPDVVKADDTTDVKDDGTEEPEEDDTDSEDLPEDDDDEDIEGDDDEDIEGDDDEDIEDDGIEDDGESDGDDDVDLSTVDGEDDDDDKMWNDLEQFKTDNGEYNLTGMGKDDVMKVMKVMKPEDEVRVVKNTNGTITLTDDETDKEYVIDLGEEGTGNSEAETELNDSEETLNEGETELGYTDDYQHDDVISGLTNDEPGKNVRSWDKGIPTGTKKPWAGKGNKAPYTQNVNEDFDEDLMLEIDLEGEDECQEGIHTVTNGPVARETAITHKHDTSHKVGRNSFAAAERFHGTGETSMPISESEARAIKQKANALTLENRQLKKMAVEIKKALEESTVITTALTKFAKLVIENATTREDKVRILNQLNNAKTIEEATQMYGTLSEDLKKAHPIINEGKARTASQLTESKATKNVIVETKLLENDGLKQTKDLMKRMGM